MFETGDSALDVDETQTGLIWKIDRFAIHDGPGIRTNIYFKGCPLRCLWCANPEGQDTGKELAFLESRCVQCGLCFDSCPHGALGPKSGLPSIDYSKCDLCERCVSSCTTHALYVFGEFYRISQLMDIIERDRHIYRRSGGGITCTGGEPLLQAKFLELLLRKCRERGIHTVLETCGYSDENRFRNVLTNVDWLFFDLKSVNSNQHIKLTGCHNQNILNNLVAASRFLGDAKKTLVVRQVIVPSLNDDENINALTELVAKLPHVDMVELLPYHNYGSYKYHGLKRNYQLDDIDPPSESNMEKYKMIVESRGLKCRIVSL